MTTNIFFTSDTHYQHKKIIEYCNRPFKDMQDMEDSLVDNWNAMVGKDDTVYHLGDFAFANKEECQRIFSRLNGRKFLIKGNHDGKAVTKLPWEDVHKFATLDSPHTSLYLVHDPKDWNEQGWLLHGHLHSKHVDTGPRQIHIGVDAWDFKPVSLDKVMQIIERGNDGIKRD